jgi:hypothetical protein
VAASARDQERRRAPLGPPPPVAVGPPATPASAPPAPTVLARELAHLVPGSAPVAATPDLPEEEVELAGGAAIAPPPAVSAYLAAKGKAGGPVRVRVGTVAAGTLRLRQRGAAVDTGPGGGFVPVALTHPLLLPLRSLGIEPVLAVRVRGGVVEGHASAMVKGKLLSGGGALLDQLEQHAETLGWRGLDRLRLSGVVNELQGSTLVIKASNVQFGLGGFLSAKGSFGLANETVTFDATATAKVPGLGVVTVPISRAADGTLTGSATVDVALRGFTGQLLASYQGGVVDVQGTVRYANEKFSGQVTLVVTDASSAKALTDSHTPAEARAADAAEDGALATPGPGAAAPAATPASAAPEAKATPRPGPRVVAGWGTVTMRLADWLSGEALVVVDHLGDVTIVSKITPRMDKPLFGQKDFIKRMPELKIQAAYGVPVIGNVFIFASVGLEAVAKLGPATLDRMEMTGNWSTKPEVLQRFGLTGTLNVSAYAGLGLIAKGGLGVEILDHEIKAGVGLKAVAGIKGYVEATPRIEYREVADPQAGKRGEFFIAGHLALAAQPFLGLEGEFFVELDSPWWSPAPDDRWDWPLGSLEYPLPGAFGIGADIEHVLGSGNLPEVTFGEVDFDAERFMTDLANDHVPPKKSTEEQKQGTWKEAEAAPGGVGAEPVTAKEPAPPAPAGEPVPKGAGPDARVPEQAEARWRSGLAALGELAKRSEAEPLDERTMRKALSSIRRKFAFTRLDQEAVGETWTVHAVMNPKGDLPGYRRAPELDLGPEEAGESGELGDLTIYTLRPPSRRRRRRRPGRSLNRSREIGLWVHANAELASAEGLLSMRLPSGEVVDPPAGFGHAEVSFGGATWRRASGRADRVDPDRRRIYEIKPRGSEERGRVQALWYAERAAVEIGYPCEWVVIVVTYDPDAVEEYLVDIGVLPAEEDVSEDIMRQPKLPTRR